MVRLHPEPMAEGGRVLARMEENQPLQQITTLWSILMEIEMFLNDQERLTQMRKSFILLSVTFFSKRRIYESQD